MKKAAEEAIVLLQNKALEGGSPLLPLAESVKKIALIGPLADNSGEMTGSWGGDRRDPDVVTVKDALEARAARLADR